MVRVETSPQLFARVGGALYLLVIGLGAYLQVVLGEVVVANDAAATSVHLVSMESMWRVGITCEVVAICCVTALAMIYFVLLRPVSRELNLLATFFRLIGLAIEAFATLSLFAALFPLAGANYLNAFTPAQLQALSVPRVESSRPRLRGGAPILRVLLPGTRAADCQVPLLAQVVGRSHSSGWRGLHDQQRGTVCGSRL